MLGHHLNELAEGSIELGHAATSTSMPAKFLRLVGVLNLLTNSEDVTIPVAHVHLADTPRHVGRRPGDFEILLEVVLRWMSETFRIGVIPFACMPESAEGRRQQPLLQADERKNTNMGPNRRPLVDRRRGFMV